MRCSGRTQSSQPAGPSSFPVCFGDEHLARRDLKWQLHFSCWWRPACANHSTALRVVRMQQATHLLSSGELNGVLLVGLLELLSEVVLHPATRNESKNESATNRY